MGRPSTAARAAEALGREARAIRQQIQAAEQERAQLEARQSERQAELRGIEKALGLLSDHSRPARLAATPAPRRAESEVDRHLVAALADGREHHLRQLLKWIKAHRRIRVARSTARNRLARLRGVQKAEGTLVYQLVR